MATRKELIDTLSALATDYSGLISERREADNLYFDESIPQPTVIRKTDESYFQIDDCEKIVAGNYKLNDENITGKSSADSVDLTYNNDIEKVEIVKPVKKMPVKPLGPECKKIFPRPLFVVLSAGTFILGIIALAIAYSGAAKNSGFLFFFLSMLYAGSFVGTCVLLMISKGGFIRLIINLVQLPKFKKAYANDMEQYKRDLAKYIADMEVAQIEYNNSLKEYEQQIALAEKEYAEKCRRLHESALLEIQNYIGVCKDYFARKKKAEAEFGKKKAEIKERYDAIALKIKSYPDTIPPKFLKVPELESTSRYDLGDIKFELKAYIDILESGRADTIKEATNCYIADKQAEEQRRILERQAEESRRREKERNRILEEQAEEQRRYNEEQMRFNEQQAEEQRRFNQQQAYEQRRRDEEMRRANAQQADAQKQLAEQQKCFATLCPRCSCHSSKQNGRNILCKYSPDGYGGCRNFLP